MKDVALNSFCQCNTFDKHVVTSHSLSRRRYVASNLTRAASGKQPEDPKNTYTTGVKYFQNIAYALMAYTLTTMSSRLSLFTRTDYDDVFATVK